MLWSNYKWRLCTTLVNSLAWKAEYTSISIEPAESRLKMPLKWQ